MFSTLFFGVPQVLRRQQYPDQLRTNTTLATYQSPPSFLGKITQDQTRGDIRRVTLDRFVEIETTSDIKNEEKVDQLETVRDQLSGKTVLTGSLGLATGIKTFVSYKGTTCFIWGLSCTGVFLGLCLLGMWRIHQVSNEISEWRAGIGRHIKIRRALPYMNLYEIYKNNYCYTYLLPEEALDLWHSQVSFGQEKLKLYESSETDAKARVVHELMQKATFDSEIIGYFNPSKKSCHVLYEKLYTEYNQLKKTFESDIERIKTDEKEVLQSYKRSNAYRKSTVRIVRDVVDDVVDDNQRIPSKISSVCTEVLTDMSDDRTRAKSIASVKQFAVDEARRKTEYEKQVSLLYPELQKLYDTGALVTAKL